MTTSLQIKGIDHIVLRIADLSRSLTFYCDILGCTVERELPDLGLYQLRAGNQLIDLVLIGTKLGGEHDLDPDRNNLDHFCLTLTLPDPDPEAALLGYLESNGIKALGTGERYGAEGFGWSVYIADPDGNTVELKPSTSG